MPAYSSEYPGTEKPIQKAFLFLLSSFLGTGLIHDFLIIFWFFDWNPIVIGLFFLHFPQAGLVLIVTERNPSIMRKILFVLADKK